MEGLKEYGINNIVAIDDTFNTIGLETKISMLDEVLVEKFDTVNELNGAFSDYAQENGEQFISDFFEEFQYKKPVVTKMLNSINQKEPDSYSELVGIPDINFNKCSPDIKEIRRILVSLKEKDERTLIIVDRKLAGKNENEGKTRLKIVLSEISEHLTDKGNFFLVMYSSDPKPLSTYEATVAYLSEELALPNEAVYKVALHINFLKKDATNESNFINVLRKSQKANYVNSFDEIFNVSLGALRERVWDLNHNESLFHYDYLVEGQQIDQIIFGIFVDKFKKGYMDFMHENFERFINPIRNSIQKYESNRVEEEFVGLDKALAKYRFIKRVNSAIHGGSNTEPVFSSDDISFGDIININDDSFVVVSQNCDITIRQNGKRAVQSFQLIKVKEIKKKINAEWLVSFLQGYSSDFKPNKINLNTSGEEYFKNTFQNPLTETELQIMGFEKRCLKEIEETLDKPNTVTLLKSLSFEGYDKDLSEICEYERDRKFEEIYTIPCFWLDTLLLRRNDENENIITNESIQKSKEIRLATKRRITSDYENMIEKLSKLPKSSLIQAFENNLFNPLVNIKPLFDEKEILIGFKLNNISRDIKLKNHVARTMHLEMIAKQTREAVNESIPI